MKLIITIGSGTLNGQKFELTTGHISIGRTEHCIIKFDPFYEKIASKQHAFIEAKDDGFYITDNNSTNGTFVNGQKIQSLKLNNSDKVQFGTNGIVASIQIFNNEKKPSESVQTIDRHNQPTVAQNLYDQVKINQIGQNLEQQQPNFNNTFGSIGLGHLEVEPVETPVGTYVIFGIVLFAILILFIPVLLIVWLNLGVGVAIIATVVAFLPATLYLLPLAWLDRYDPEPIWLLFLAFAWGAIVSVFFSAIINDTLGFVATIATQNPDLGGLFAAVVSAPIFEELSKGIGLLLLLVFLRRKFDDILDGIIFGGVIALGFATVENVLYYGQAILDCGAQGLAILFFLRGILSPFAHVTFTAMTGIGCGISRESHNTAVKFLAPVIGYFAAVLLHMIWNGMSIVVVIILEITELSGVCSTMGSQCSISGLCPFFIAYALVEVPFFFIFVGFSIWMMRRQNRILKEMLAIDVARGMIPQEHLDKVTSAAGSLFWSLAGLTSGKYMARRRYMQAIGKLGLSYWHIQRATIANGETGSFQQNPILRNEVLKWKDKV